MPEDKAIPLIINMSNRSQRFLDIRLTEGLPARENFVLMPEGTEILIYIVLAPFAAVFIYGLYSRLRGYHVKTVIRSFKKDPWGFTKAVINFGLAQRRVLQDIRAGLMHLLISFGAFALFIGTLMVFIDHDVLRAWETRLLIGDLYLMYEFLLDFFGLLFLLGLAYAIFRRACSKPSRLSYKREYIAILSLLACIGISGFILEGVRIYLRNPDWGMYSPIGALLAASLSGLQLETDLLLALYKALWWVHAVASFVGLAVLPYSSLLHILVAPLNVAVNRAHVETPGRVETPFILSKLSLEEPFQVVGLGSPSDFKPNQKIQLDACMDCGRCDEVCPPLIAGTKLSPRMVVQKLRQAWWEGGNKDFLTSNIFTLDEIYACTNCAACELACPVLISPMTLIIELRRAFALRGLLTKKGYETLTNLARARNPFGLGRSERMRLLEELTRLGAKRIEDLTSVKRVLWIGCMGVYDPRAQLVVKQLVSLLVSSGFEFAVMCSEEICNGDPARRLGEEGRYQELAEEVIEMLKSKGVTEVITHCPHCFDVFSRQYRDLGADFKVTNHITLLSRLAREGKLKLNVEGEIIIHDSCIYARVYGLVNEPREILSGLKLAEPKRSGRFTFCCGAGGGGYWLDVKRVKRESILRMEELLESGADNVVTECPFCLSMLEDAVRVLGVIDRVKVKDISELLKPA